jgi:hypothetical protein
MERANGKIFPWRPAILGPLTFALFLLALYFYNNLHPELGLLVLGLTFAVPMGWTILAARAADYRDSPIRAFVPRFTLWLIFGSLVLGALHWNLDRRITQMEIAFAGLYIVAAYAAMRALAARPKRPELTALSGGNLERRQRRRKLTDGGKDHGRKAKA